MSPRYCSIYRALVALACLHSAAAVTYNRTIDDQNGDSASGAPPTFSPQNEWTVGNQCQACFAQLDASLAFDHTWHDATIHDTDIATEQTISMSFTGTAVYAYCIMDNNNTYNTLTNLTFSIDGEKVGAFLHQPDGSDSYLYNTLVYSNTSLKNEEHQFIIHSPRNTAPYAALVLFDYVVYTVDTDNSTSPSSTISSSPKSTTSATSSPSNNSAPSHGVSIAAIVGGVVGGLIGIALIIVACFLLIRRRKQHGSRVRDFVVDSEEPPPGTLKGSPDDAHQTGSYGYTPLHTASDPFLAAGLTRQRTAEGVAETTTPSVALSSLAHFPQTPVRSGSDNRPSELPGLTTGSESYYSPDASAFAHQSQSRSGTTQPTISSFFAVNPDHDVGAQQILPAALPSSMPKSAVRREELSRQLQAREEEMQSLRRRQTLLHNNDAGNNVVPSSTAPSSGNNNNIFEATTSQANINPLQLGAQVTELQREVDRLRDMLNQAYTSGELEALPQYTS